MHLMIVVSDNTATNLILDRIGGNAVNVRMAQLGLKQTAVMRKIMQTKLFPDPDAKPHPEGLTDEGKKPGNDRWGTGRSCPRDMVLILEKLYRGELVSKAASGEMISVLKRQHDHDGVGGDMKNTVIASKSGALGPPEKRCRHRLLAARACSYGDHGKQYSGSQLRGGQSGQSPYIEALRDSCGRVGAR